MALSDSKYKDSFISQDELDSLLKEAESTPLTSDDDLKDATESPSSIIDESSDDAIITQDDIDALLNLGRSVMEEDDHKEKAGDELVTQDDIDALLAKRPSKKKAEPAPELELADDDFADLDLVTPDDIKKLLQSEAPVGFSADKDDGDDGMDSISDDDIKALLSGTDLTRDLEDDESESAENSELITQDDIDLLLSGVEKDEKKDEDDRDGMPMPDTGTVGNLVSKEDIDNLLKGAGGFSETVDGAAAESQEPSDDVNLISQDDIDKLLMGKYQEPEEEETTLIDQEDIDRLLSSARPFGDGQLAKAPEPDKLISQEDIDRLLQEDEREKSKTDDDLHDQVILEKPDKVDAPKKKQPKPKKTKEKKPIPKKKLLVAAAVFLFLAVAGAGSYFVHTLKFKGEAPETADVSETVHGDKQGAEVMGSETGTDMAFHGENAVETLETITVNMKNFVAVAPEGATGISVISLSLTLQIAETPENPVKEYEPFFRNIVYEVMNKALASQGETAVNEADLKVMIMDALNQAFAKGSVSALEFTEFEAG